MLSGNITPSQRLQHTCHHAHREPARLQPWEGDADEHPKRIQQGAWRLFSHPGKAGSKGKITSFQRGGALLSLGKKEQKATAGAMEEQGELDVAGVPGNVCGPHWRRTRGAVTIVAQLETLLRRQTTGSH